MKGNLKFTEFLPYEEELLDMIDFNSNDKSYYTNKKLISDFFPGGNSQAIGRALSKIENYYPNAVRVKRIDKGMGYYMAIKKEYLNKNNEGYVP